MTERDRRLRGRKEVVVVLELIVLGALAVAALACFGVLLSAVSLVGWLLFWPFRLMGLAFKAAAWLLALPFLLLAGLIALAFGGFGALLLFVPLAPFLLLVLAIGWVVRRNRPLGIGSTTPV